MTIVGAYYPFQERIDVFVKELQKRGFGQQPSHLRGAFLLILTLRFPTNDIFI